MNGSQQFIEGVSEQKGEKFAGAVKFAAHSVQFGQHLVQLDLPEDKKAAVIDDFAHLIAHAMMFGLMETDLDHDEVRSAASEFMRLIKTEGIPHTTH